MLVTVRDKLKEPSILAARYGHYALFHFFLNYTAVIKLSGQRLYLRRSWDWKVPYYT